MWKEKPKIISMIFMILQLLNFNNISSRCFRILSSMAHLRPGLFGGVKYVVYLPHRQDRPNLSDVYLNVYDLVKNDFFNNLAQAFSISGLEKIEKDFFKRLGQDFLSIG